VLLAVKVPLSAIDGQNVVPLLSNVELDGQNVLQLLLNMELWYSSTFMTFWEWGSHNDVAGPKILMDYCHLLPGLRNFCALVCYVFRK
jgi:hypothetical protein